MYVHMRYKHTIIIIIIIIIIINKYNELQFLKKVQGILSQFFFIKFIFKMNKTTFIYFYKNSLGL